MQYDGPRIKMKLICLELTYGSITAACFGTVLQAPQDILPHLQDDGVPCIPVQVHEGLRQLGAQRVALTAPRRTPRTDVVHLRREAVLSPHAVVVLYYSHCRVRVPCKVNDKITFHSSTTKQNIEENCH